MGEALLHLSLPVLDVVEAREFYEHVLGCRVGRVRDDWVDVWFFGLQLTLQQRPDQVAALRDPGVRHFGVTLPDRDVYDRLVERIGASGHAWLSPPSDHGAQEISGKVGGKLKDPSGNVIEIKHYPNPDALVSP